VDFNSILSWLRGEPKVETNLAPPLANYPTTSDADYARKYQFGYGTGMEPYLNNQQANIIGQNIPLKNFGGKSNAREFFPQSATDINQSMITDPSSAQNVNLQDKAHSDLRGIMDNTYMRAALAANRIPLSGIGYDPSHFNVDAISPPLTVGGLYSPKNDQGFSTVAPDDSLVHESTHRGINKLREAYPAEFEQVTKNLPPEEMIVRYLMKHQAGNPEAISGTLMAQRTGKSSDLKQQNQAEEMFTDPIWGKTRQKALNDLQEMAIRYKKEKNPRGPH